MIPQVMPFRRRFSQNALRPVNRIKHVIDNQGGITIGTAVVVKIIESKDTPVIANVTECQTGSKVNGIYLKVEAYATSTAALANLYMAVMKDPGNALTNPTINAIGASEIKKYIIHQEMVMMEKNTTGNPRTVFNGVIAIPKGYRRNGPSDVLKVILLTPGVTADFCLQCHYKEYR